GERTMVSAVSIDVEGVPLKTTLTEVLKQLGLAYVMRDGAVFISSPKGVERERRKPEKEIPALDATPKTKAVLARPSCRCRCRLRTGRRSTRSLPTSSGRPPA